jgi:isohexenylglutaconyl-CoA hydratase
MTSLPATNSIILSLEHGWLTIAFNRPDNRNALSEELAGELTSTLEAVHGDRSVRGITLRGNGGVFCAGGDLKSFKSNFHGDAGTQNAVIASNKAGGALFALINTMPQVVLVLVDGPAIAGGLGMVCCADIVAVTNQAKFSLTETQLGIAPAQIAPYVVQRFGLNTARRLMLTGARFTGAEAVGYGLADFVVDDATGFDAIEAEIRNSVMRCAPNANAVTKEIVLATPHLSVDDMQNFAAKGFAKCMMSEEGKEGMASFAEKRKPSWAT